MTNPNGRFGIHGGQYIPETLMNAVIELEEAYNHYKNDPEFNRELTELFNEYAGRPSRLYYAEKMTKDLGGAKIYLKREDLNHTGAHKINNVLGQALLAQKMGKTRLIAETGAGQHGVATATAAALMGMECVVFMGEEDTKRQALNVYRMRLLGAEVIPVTSGTGTLKDAVSEAMREWTSRISDTHYCLGSVMGPHPFPTIVRDFQAVISKEIKEQMLEKEGRLPDAVIACVGGGSNAIGSFYNFINDKTVRLIGCEAAGRGIDTPQAQLGKLLARRMVVEAHHMLGAAKYLGRVVEALDDRHIHRDKQVRIAGVRRCGHQAIGALHKAVDARHRVIVRQQQRNVLVGEKLHKR